MGNDSPNETPLIAAVLLLWGGVAVALVRAAERRATGSASAPSPIAVVSAIAIAFGATTVRATPATATACGVACIALVVAAEADVRTGLLFDAVTFPAALLTAAIGLVAGDAAAAAWGVVMLVGPFGTLVVVSRGRAMGLGDVKAMFAIGAAFGPLESLIAIFGACISGILAATLAHRLRPGESLRFGPHLAAGCALALSFGDPIVHFITRP